MHEKFNNIEELEVLLEKTDRAEIQRLYDSNGKEESEWVRVYNTTKNHTEVVVPEQRGQVVCHSEAFAPLLNALRQQEGIELFGFFHNHGGTVTTEILFKNAMVDDGSEGGIKLGLRFTNNYSRLNFSGENFGYRSYCNNGMALGKTLFNQITANHRNMARLTKDTLAFIDIALGKTKMLEGIIEKAKIDTLMNEEDALKILIGEVTGEKTAKKIIELDEHLFPWSRYSLYNCITNYSTHAVTNESRRNYLQKQAQKILVTPSNKLFRGETRAEKEREMD